MLTLHHISYTIEDIPILTDLTLHLSSDEITALIGKNGSGKTTLLRLLAGELTPDSGHIRSEGEKIGYLPQDFKLSEKNIKQFFEGWPEYQILQVLEKVALTISLEASLTNLSGGEKTKLGLAKLLLEEPTVLLLDEPTNNLDATGLVWLSTFVEEFRGSILFTSHDRAFLDKVSTRTLELKGSILKSFGGNYTFTREQQAREQKAYQDKYEAQQNYREHLEKDITTTKSQAVGVEESTKEVNTRRYAKKVARKATVREARLEREMQRTDWLEKPRGEDPYFIAMPETAIPQAKLVLEVEDLGKKWADRWLFEHLSFQLIGREHLQISGSNGSGKSTLFNLIMSQLNPDSGTIKLGATIRVGYFSQDIQLEKNLTGKTELFSTVESPTRCIQYARALGMTMQDLEKPTRLLSRGQQAKIAFAKILLTNPQLLILDEPTNHLELETREAIEKAMQQFEGALLIASHDRFFIEKLGIDKQIDLDQFSGGKKGA